jgi:hypothetical protein
MAQVVAAAMDPRMTLQTGGITPGVLYAVLDTGAVFLYNTEQNVWTEVPAIPGTERAEEQVAGA